MSDFQSEKRVVRDYYEALDATDEANITDVLIKFTAENYIWRALQPFNIQTKAEAVSSIFWQPFRKSIRHVQRRMEVILAGKNFIDNGDTVWV